VVCAHGKKILYWEKAQVEASQQAQSYFSKWVAEGSAFGTLSEYGARFILLDHNDKVALRLETVHTAGDGAVAKAFGCKRQEGVSIQCQQLVLSCVGA
jgi:hypothetical protein